MRLPERRLLGWGTASTLGHRSGADPEVGMGRHSPRRRRGWALGVAAIATLAAAWAASATATAADPTALRAELDGRPIGLADVSRYHCHDRAYPLIRCFDTALERDRDEGVVGATTKPATNGDVAEAITAAAIPYVRWYLDANYGGPSFDAYIDYRDLGSVGWNDKISSFQTVLGAHPRWWRDLGFVGTSWDWGSTSVPYVGDAANDRFSSVDLV
jgi:hypothetical protein